MSVPCAIAPMPAATAAAAPPDEPPAVTVASRGFSVAPWRRLSVNQRSAKAGALVRPSRIAPLFSRLSTTGLLVAATGAPSVTAPLLVA